ncbi:MAG: hypothetical protein V3T31_11030, partial [candidate division Zixibacteria bacterium]
NTCPDDNCPLIYNPGQVDGNSNGIGDACDWPNGVPQIDTIFSDCLGLVLRPDGNFGNSGQSGVSMDFLSSGDCDGSATIYIYDGSPLLSWDDGGTKKVAFNMYNTLYNKSVSTGNSWEATTVTSDFERYRTGTFVTSDSSLGMDKTWWAPRSVSTDCNFVVQCLRVYSFDGETHTGVAVGEGIDWDIPSDDVTANVGGFSVLHNIIYLQGTEYNGSGCQPNDTRFGGQGLLGIGVGSSLCAIDAAAEPHGAYTADNATYLYASNGFDADELYPMIRASGFSAYPAWTDQHTVMSFLSDQTIVAGDTVFIYTALATIESGTVTDLENACMAARSWFTSVVLPSEGCDMGCCVGSTGNINCDPADGVDISDLTTLVNHLFVTFEDLCCPEEANVNGDPAGGIDISDLTRLVNHLFVTFESLAPCAK